MEAKSDTCRRANKIATVKHVMQAIILAGGKGTRLRSLTEDVIPKPLVPIKEKINGKIESKPLLDHVINHAEKYGCTDIIVCTGHLGHKIQEHIAANQYTAAVSVSQEERPLGTAGALRLIKDLLADEFFILYGDIYTTINLKKMLQFHKKNNADVTIAVHTSDHPQDSTVAQLDDSGKFVAMIEKPGDDWKKYGNLTQTSLYIVKKDVLDFIPEGKSLDLAKDIFPTMLKKKKRLFGYITNEFAKDVGTPERYTNVLERLHK